MRRTITYLLQAMAERRRARRRQANLRAGAGAAAAAATAAATVAAAIPNRRRTWCRTWPGHSRALAAGGVVACLAGAGLIAGHARHLAAAAMLVADEGRTPHMVHVFQSALPGARFQVRAAPGVQLSLLADGALVTVAGMLAAPPVRIDLCSQLRAANDARMVPLRLGYRFDDVRRWVERNRDGGATPALHNVLLVDAPRDGEAPMPEIQISGPLRPDFASPDSEALQLRWRSVAGDTRWLSDTSLGQVEQGAGGQVSLREQGWLTWGNGAAAMRLERRSNALCPQAGELLVQLYRAPQWSASRDRQGLAALVSLAGLARAAPVAAPDALVTAFPARGKPVGATLSPGDYLVPAAPRPPLEDQMLFRSLLEKGLLRVRADGDVETAPRDLAQWAASPMSARASALASWRGVAPDPATARLLKRLYYEADGAYVRQQIGIYNDERRLLAWRVPEGTAGSAQWGVFALPAAAEASDELASSPMGAPRPEAAATAANSASTASGMVADAATPLATTGQMPPAAARLFAELPQGWQPWTRLARGPQAGRRLILQALLAHPATAGQTMQLLLIGHVQAVHGARVLTQPACTGRACAAPGDVRQLTLELSPGTRSVRLDVAPIQVNSPEERKYRHLAITAGRLEWQALAVQGTPARAASATTPAQVQLRDRNGTPLYADGAPTQAALDAGMATLLGVNPGQANGIAGMLARLPATVGGPVAARLTLDLPLQALSQSVLDCVAMRRGHWTGKGCAGGQAAPDGRHAGVVILDTETGDLLAAAGAGTGTVSAANWAEVRDFDRANPARSALRLPALQHDGGAHQSPGSTFKIVSALGLELAAQRDPRIDGLLAGMPLAAINRMAARRGFGFQTDAAAYPLDTRLAHITNYKEQGLDRRAQDGRLGLAQALTYSLNTWFAWSGELSDASLFGRPDGGAPDLQALDADALDAVRPILAAAHRLGFGQPLRLDGGLLPPDFHWQPWDALQATPAHIDPIHTRHELRQMTIGLRMQATPLQMALAAGAVGQGAVIAPRMLLALDDRQSAVPPEPKLGIRLDRIRAGMKGVIDVGTAAGAFGGPALAALRPHLYGKTGTAPSGDGTATVWFAGWLEPGSLPGQRHRLALAVFASHSEATGGEHAAPVAAAILAALAGQNREQKGK